MTKHFRDDDGRRWKAWLASRDVFWPDPDESVPDPDLESVIFVCFTDPNQPQKRIRLPSGSFVELSSEDLKTSFLSAEPVPAIR